MSDKLNENLIAQAKQVEDLTKIYQSIEETMKVNDSEIIELKKRSENIKKLLGIKDMNIKKNISLQMKDNSGYEDTGNINDIKSFEEVTRDNLIYLESHNLLDFEFDNLFSKEDLIRIERELSSPILREKWDKWDYVAVFSGSIAGIVADFFTSGIDKQLQNWLGNVSNTDLISKWENSSKASIDYQGPGFGGPLHRGLSSGHDILRIFSAFWQIKNGIFVGLKQTSSGFEWIKTTSNQYGQTFNTYEGLEVFLVWAKHLIADFCTSKSLPFPGMSFLMEMPDHDIRKFAIQMYQNGYNLRFILA